MNPTPTPPRRRRLGRRVAEALARPLGVVALRLLAGSCRTTIAGWDGVEAEHARGRAVIFSLWHNRLLLPVWFFRHRHIHVLVSRHPDGELVARVLERVGFVAVRGSAERAPGKQKKGGVEALHHLARCGRAGCDIAFTPDGPRGPVYSVAPGLLTLVRLTGLKVVPVGIEMARWGRLGSWDRFRVPRPFTRVACVFGPPLALSPEPARAHAGLVEAMKQVTFDAAARVGVENPFADAGGATVGALKRPA